MSDWPARVKELMRQRDRFRRQRYYWENLALDGIRHFHQTIGLERVDLALRYAKEGEPK